MRSLKITVITVFFLVSTAFTAYFSYSRLILDHTPPLIICDGTPLKVKMGATTEELCAGLIATDNVDGDITDRILVRKISQLVGSNRALIYYVVFDTSSNFSVFSRELEYTDYQKPTFLLTKPLIYNVSSIITLEDRLYAFDAIDGDITDNIRVSSDQINRDLPGNYPIVIQVTNNQGDTSVATLTVRIENADPRQPIINLDSYLLTVRLEDNISDEELMERLRSLIIEVRQSYGGDLVDPSEVAITLDDNPHSRRSRLAMFTYINEQGFEKTIPFTIIVE